MVWDKKNVPFVSDSSYKREILKNVLSDVNIS